MAKLLRLLLMIAMTLPWLGLAPRPVSAQPTRAAIPIPLDRPLRFERFSLADGLSQNSALSLLQDSKGYLWIGTQDGLNRYDGYSFTVFKHDPENRDSLSNNSIISLLEDKDGLLWVGTWGGGLNRFDPSSSRFTRFQHDPSQPGSLNGEIVAAICQDGAGRLWVGTIGGGLNLFDPKTETFTHYTQGLDSSAVSSILPGADGQLWLGTGGYSSAGAGLYRFDPSSGQAKRAIDPGAPGEENIAALQLDASGALWIATGGYALPGAGLLRLDPSTGAIERYTHNPNDPSSLANNSLLNLRSDSSGILWIASYGGGLDRLDPRNPGAGFAHARNNPFNPESLSSDQTWGLLQDRSGVMWVGTVNGGLNKLNPQVQQFRLFRSDPGDPNSLGFNAVGPLLEDHNGRLWVGTLGGGLALYQPAAGTFIHYTDPTPNANTIMALREDARGTLWVGSLNGLAAFNPTNGQFVRHSHDPANPDSLIDNNVSAIVEDASQRLWVGTLSGLELFDREHQRFEHMQIAGMGAVVSLLIDREQKLWVGTWGSGLFRLDPASAAGSQIQVLDHFQADPNQPASLSDNSIWSFYQGDDGILWLGTGGGLNRLDPQTRTFDHYREKDGLANDSALCILGAAPGQLWISTNSGISRFDPAAKTFQTYDLHDGLQSNEFDSGSCLKTGSGELFFGGVNGLSAFNPNDLRLNTTPPPVVLTAFRIFNEAYPVALADGTPIRLSYRQDFISFEFAGLDYFAPKQNQYAYKLEGFDKDWVQAGTRRYASYTNLNGGDYVFRVKAANNDGVWNETGLALPIQVTPPIWFSWWFLGGILLFALTAAAAGVRWRIETVRDQARRLETQVSERTATLRDANEQLQIEMDQRLKAEQILAHKAAEEAVMSERNRLARDLHDAVTQTLFSASLLADVLPELVRQYPAEGEKRLTELRQLTRGALAEMRTLLVELRPSALTDVPLPDLLRQLAEATTGRARLPVQVSVDGEADLPADVRVAFYRITQEALNNAVKYSRAELVSINLRLTPELARLTIIDNGAGFDPAAVPPNHFGLRIMRERAEACGARISIYAEPNEGTQITVSYPAPK
jgi:signal transduction histidine kinase/streptogramin lyase